MPVKVAGATPTIVYGWLWMRIVWPMADGLAANSRVQSRYEMTTTRGAPARSSSGRSARPTTGATPSSWK